MRFALYSILALALLASSTGQARADDLEIDFGGRVQTDIRFRPVSVGIGEYYNRVELGSGVSRNENIVKLKVNAAYGNFGAVAEIDLVLYGYNQELEGLGSLSLREEVDPFRIEAHAAYVEAYDLFFDGLDMRAGYQVVSWGVGDQFNPTNNLNSLDLEDPLLFGEQLANLMVKLDYNFKDVWSISAVLVPIFKPALLPESGKIGVAAVDRFPFVDADLRHKFIVEKELALLAGDSGHYKHPGLPTIVNRAIPVTPDTSFNNMQFAFRIAGMVLEQDIAISYYNGRTDMPQPYLNQSRWDGHDICDPKSSGTTPSCYYGSLQSDVYMGYPKMQVIGLNLAGQIPLEWISKKLTALGYRLEMGVYLPEAAGMSVEQLTPVTVSDFTSPAGEYDYGKYASDGGRRPLVVEDTPFVKWVFGLDYTISRNVYVNVQWVHGFPDEYGAGDWITEGWKVQASKVNDRVTKEDLTTARALAQVCDIMSTAPGCDTNALGQFVTETLRPRIGDYLVLGLDFRFLADKLLLRLFTIWDLSGMDHVTYSASGEPERTHYSMFTSEGFSAVLYPELHYTFGNGLELGAGALIYLGDEDTRFGDPATGGHQIFTRARFSY